MLFQQSTSTLSFKHWLLQDKENRLLLWFSAAAMVIAFTWLKIIYPYPNFMPPDSTNYVEAAFRNDFINFWPIGYSKFLRLISSFTNSDFALVTIQYLLLIGALLYFLISIRYLLSPGTFLFRIILVLSICNPLLPHIANFVSSDALFISVSLVWLTQLFWIFYRPNNKLLIFHGIVVVAAFSIRFAALYYPLISIGAIIVCKMPFSKKKLGIACIALPLFIFIGRTQYEYKLKTDTIQYAAFGGWQLAANALYGYAFSDSISSEAVPIRFKNLQVMVNHHIDSMRKLFKRPDEKIGTYYLWDRTSPLKLNVEKMLSKEPAYSTFKKWAMFGPYYAAYGRYLIAKRPSDFIKYFVWPNLIRYYSPPPYFMGDYNVGNQTVEPIVKNWFDWKDNNLPTKNKERIIQIATFFSTIFSIVNTCFLLISIMFLLTISIKRFNVATKSMLISTCVIWCTNSLFSILTAPIELRYELFPFIVAVPFTIIFSKAIINSMNSIESLEKNNTVLLGESKLIYQDK